MPKYLILASLVLTACGSKPGEQSALRWQLASNESLVYRVTGQGSAVVDGDARGAQEVSGYLFVDVDGDGDASIRLDASSRFFGVPSMELNPGGSNFFFPLPESAMTTTGKPVVQSFTIKGLGTTATRTNPDTDDGTFVRLTFSREGTAAGGLVLKAEGTGIFDVKAGRYERLERTTRITVSGDFGGQNGTIELTIDLALEFDADRSKARTKERAQLRQPAVTADELAEYVEANPVESEISRAVRSVANNTPTAFLYFHRRANPVATWKQAMTLSPEQRDAFVSGVSIHVGRGERLPNDLVDWFKSELPKQPALENAVANMQDERLRDQLVSLASITDPDKGWIARRAGSSLEAIDAQAAGPRALLLTADARQFVAFGLALQARGQDYRALVPVLIEVLEKSASSSPTSKMAVDDICVQWLEGLVSRSFGKDVSAWKEFWEANKDKSYCQWMIEAAAQDTPLLVHNALSRLSTCRESPQATDYLATRVDKGMGDIRHLAALSLAEHEDTRAISVLIDMLAGDDQQLRAMALVALANYHNTTLGYDLEGDDAGRAAALRRWRAWVPSVQCDMWRRSARHSLVVSAAWITLSRGAACTLRDEPKIACYR